MITWGEYTRLTAEQQRAIMRRTLDAWERNAARRDCNDYADDAVEEARYGWSLKEGPPL